MKERDMVHPTDRELSRRSFLKGTVLAGAGVGAMGALAACAPSGAKDDLASTGVAADSVTWDKETDIVVVGFGGAGSAAAIEARKAGPKSSSLRHPALAAALPLSTVVSSTWAEPLCRRSTASRTAPRTSSTT